MLHRLSSLSTDAWCWHVAAQRHLLVGGVIVLSLSIYWTDLNCSVISESVSYEPLTYSQAEMSSWPGVVLISVLVL